MPEIHLSSNSRSEFIGHGSTMKSGMHGDNIQESTEDNRRAFCIRM